jgi:hypothetical protein
MEEQWDPAMIHIGKGKVTPALKGGARKVLV